MRGGSLSDFALKIAREEIGAEGIELARAGVLDAIVGEFPQIHRADAGIAGNLGAVHPWSVEPSDHFFLCHMPTLSVSRFSVKPDMHRQSDTGIAHNGRMENMELRQILARNLRQAMEDSIGLDTQLALARRAGIAQSHLSEVLRAEASPTTDMLNVLARALGLEPWELLANDEATRQAALQKMILGPRASDARVAENLPPAPKKEAAARRRKKTRGGDNPPAY